MDYHTQYIEMDNTSNKTSKFLAQIKTSLPQKSEPWIHRIIWLFIYSGCLIGLLIVAYNNLEEFFNYDISASFSEKAFYNHSQLPDVVICNLKGYRSISNNKVTNQFRLLENKIDNAFLQHLVLNRTNDQTTQEIKNISDKMERLFKSNIPYPFNYSSYNENEFSRNSFILSCIIEYKPCKSNWFKKLMTEDYGVCYILKDYQSALEENAQGNENGIKLLFYLDSDQDFAPYKGVRITTMYPGYPVSPESSGLEAPGNSKMTIGLKPAKLILQPNKKHTCTSEPIKIHKKLNCQDDSLLPFVTKTKHGSFIPYSYSWCLRHCEHKISTDYCKCPTNIYLDHRECCDLNIKQNRKCLKNIDKYNKSSPEGNALNFCYEECEISCTQFSYESQATYSEFPTPSFMSLILASPLKYKKERHIDSILQKLSNYIPKNFHTFSEEVQNLYFQNAFSLLRKQFVEVDIYLETVLIAETHLHSKVSIWQLLSDLGGTAGLFMGVSLLTIFEIIDILLKSSQKAFQKSTNINH